MPVISKISDLKISARPKAVILATYPAAPQGVKVIQPRRCMIRAADRLSAGPSKLPSLLEARPSKRHITSAVICVLNASVPHIYVNEAVASLELLDPTRTACRTNRPGDRCATAYDRIERDGGLNQSHCDLYLRRGVGAAGASL